MGDPFLRSTGDEADTAAGSAGDDLRHRSWLPQAVIDLIPQAAVDQFVSRTESWAELARELDQALVSAGFHGHDPVGAGGGFWIATHLRDDGVLVSWASRDCASYEPESFEIKIRNIMQPALDAILTTCGFRTELIPDGQDDAGSILVTSRTDIQA